MSGKDCWKGGHCNVADLEKSAPREFPLWANVHLPGRMFDRALYFALRRPNVCAGVTAVQNRSSRIFARFTGMFAVTGIFYPSELY